LFGYMTNTDKCRFQLKSTAKVTPDTPLGTPPSSRLKR
jgi:hypothetical protein